MHIIFTSFLLFEPRGTGFYGSKCGPYAAQRSSGSIWGMLSWQIRIELSEFVVDSAEESLRWRRNLALSAGEQSGLVVTGRLGLLE